ncbi:GNAT family N-acetyltransferase [Sporosarcina sp. Te-1]|uniref:GNAT family N-acetyltransferase n=1 Tax=Sporosarcina sp. Te-1 TaxID=2818390 RepID=UPI001A9F55DE|nr:GNAT family N-acetyltransferase [Sporosarcina sp. Te-1]QTD41476.1 GNAT family N-acetyltransferase [Sporosarcina sp. Te-1]
MVLQLVKPALEYEEAYQSFHNEWNFADEMYTPSFIRKGYGHFKDYVQQCLLAEKGLGIPKDWLPYSTYWLIENKRILGASILRHGLNKCLSNSEGHISLGIRPSDRGSGYGAVFLSLALAELKKLGVGKALVVCEEGNIPSEKTILRVGGIRDIDYIERDGTVLQRYWIII